MKEAFFLFFWTLNVQLMQLQPESPHTKNTRERKVLAHFLVQFSLEFCLC